MYVAPVSQLSGSCFLPGAYSRPLSSVHAPTGPGVVGPPMLFNFLPEASLPTKGVVERRPALCCCLDQACKVFVQWFQKVSGLSRGPGPAGASNPMKVLHHVGGELELNHMLDALQDAA